MPANATVVVGKQSRESMEDVGQVRGLFSELVRL